MCADDLQGENYSLLLKLFSLVFMTLDVSYVSQNKYRYTIVGIVSLYLNYLLENIFCSPILLMVDLRVF